MKKDINFEVSNIHIEINTRHTFTVDIAIDEWGIELNNFIISWSENEICIEIPENFCPTIIRSFSTLNFTDIETWKKMKKTIKDFVESREWLMLFLRA